MRSLLLFACITALLACTSKPVMNLTDQYVPTTVAGKQLSVSDVQRAILSATQKRGWSSRVIRPGLIEANLSVRTHRASVEIEYDASQYSIRYKSSENLDYDEGSIHRNYNNWVNKLSRTIQSEMGVRAQSY